MLMRDPAAEIGHNSRRDDIERTADEIRMRFIRMNVGHNLPYATLSYKWRTMSYAYVSGMKPGPFMELFGHLAHANADGSNSFASHETRAALRGCSVSTCERDTAELEKLGFLPTEDKKRRKQKSAIRCIQVPQAILDAFPLQDQEPANLMVQDLRTRKFDGSCTKFEVQEPSNLNSRPVKSDGLPLDLTLVVVEGNTLCAREDGCGSKTLQPRKGKEEARQGELVAEARDHSTAEPLLLPTREHLQEFAEVAWEFNYPSNSLPPPPATKQDHKYLQRAKTGLSKTIEAALNRAERPFVLEALDFALTITGLKECRPEHNRGPAPALSFFNSTFARKLDEIRKREHNARVNAKETEVIAENRVETERRIGEKKIMHHAGILDASAANRLAAPVKMNGHPAPVGDNRTCINPAGKRRYKTNFGLVKAYGQIIVFGEHANKLLDELEAAGATFEDVDEAFGHETGTAPYGDHQALSRPEVLRSVSDRVKRSIARRRDAELQQKFPIEEQCGGNPDPAFRSKWLALSGQWIAALFARCPDIRLDENGRYGSHNYGIGSTDDNPRRSVLHGIFDAVTRELNCNHSDYGNGLQQRAEAEIESAMLRVQANEAENQRRKHGLWLNETGGIEIASDFMREIARRIAQQPVRDRLWDAVRGIPETIGTLGPSVVAERIRECAWHAECMSTADIRAALARDEIGRAA